MVGDDAPWLTRLVGGLPADFDYGVIRSADDVRSLILTLPSHDRGMAARGLHDHRWLVGRNAAYRGIMTAWDHNERNTIDAFGSGDQFIAAVKDVAPPLALRTPSKRITAWRGVKTDRADCLQSALGLCRRFNPSLLPFVFRVDLDPRAIVAAHNGRYEQELLVDVQQLLNHVITIDGYGSFERTRLHPGSEAARYLFAEWRRAANCYEHRKSARNRINRRRYHVLAA